jgi:Spy/CpxP family protein refolding chaperone
MPANPTISRTRRLLSLAAVIAILITICVSASLLTTRWVMHERASHSDETLGHNWLHDKLGLTTQEEQAIAAFEGDYRAERDALMQAFNLRITDLRERLVEQDDYSPEIDAAIHRIHEVHGKLQELSIRHYYDMMRVLPADKQAMLRELAVKALSQPE